MNTDYWGTAIPNWIMAIATTLALFAGLYAWRVYRFEQVKERKRYAELLSIWWVEAKATASSTSSKYGLILDNSGRHPLFDLEIDTNSAAHEGYELCKLGVLAPGRYFVESPRKGHQWHTAKDISNYQLVTPLSRSGKHHLTRYSFKDVSGLLWEWVPEYGLARIWSRKSMFMRDRQGN